MAVPEMFPLVAVMVAWLRAEPEPVVNMAAPVPFTRVKELADSVPPAETDRFTTAPSTGSPRKFVPVTVTLAVLSPSAVSVPGLAETVRLSTWPGSPVRGIVVDTMTPDRFSAVNEMIFADASKLMV